MLKGVKRSVRPVPSVMLKCRATLRLLVIALATHLTGQGLTPPPAQAQVPPYCQQLPVAIAQKDKLRQAAIQGNRDAQKRYKDLVAQQAEKLRKCRGQSWNQNSAIWLRLYPCDAKAGALEGVLDRIVDRGYNKVYVEAFYNGKVLLPANSNPTPWTAVLAGSGLDNVDLLAQVIRKGRERGLKVYAWLFSMNFGASYFRSHGKQPTMARNGLGQTSLTARTIAGLSVEIGAGNPDEAFVDPYNAQARQDYAQVVRAIAQRKPDGMLFDYIRYPRGSGGASVAARVQDLWVYGDASYQALLGRAMNYRGMELIQRYLNQGFISGDDVKEAVALYPKEGEPMWQGRSLSESTGKLAIAQRVASLQADLWQLTIAHAAQGVLDFFSTAIAPAQQLGIPVGVVFFPEGNSTVGQGFDSRLQFWNRFPPSVEWHPMLYATCGSPSCIVAQFQRVLKQAPATAQVKPVLAGIWQQSVGNRPPLEVQMEAVYRAVPSLKSMSHFAYSWQEPGSDRDRKYCQP